MTVIISPGGKASPQPLLMDVTLIGGAKKVAFFSKTVANWDPLLHPKDSKGKFIETPDELKLPAGGVYKGDVVVTKAGKPFVVEKMSEKGVKVTPIDSETGQAKSGFTVLGPNTQVGVIEPADPNAAYPNPGAVVAHTPTTTAKKPLSPIEDLLEKISPPLTPGAKGPIKNAKIGQFVQNKKGKKFVVSKHGDTGWTTIHPVGPDGEKAGKHTVVKQDQEIEVVEKPSAPKAPSGDLKSETDTSGADKESTDDLVDAVLNDDAEVKELTPSQKIIAELIAKNKANEAAKSEPAPENYPQPGDALMAYDPVEGIYTVTVESAGPGQETKAKTSYGVVQQVHLLPFGSVDMLDLPEEDEVQDAPDESWAAWGTEVALPGLAKMKVAGYFPSEDGEDEEFYAMELEDGALVGVLKDAVPVASPESTGYPSPGDSAVGYHPDDGEVFSATVQSAGPGQKTVLKVSDYEVSDKVVALPLGTYDSFDIDTGEYIEYVDSPPDESWLSVGQAVHLPGFNPMKVKGYLTGANGGEGAYAVDVEGVEHEMFMPKSTFASTFLNDEVQTHTYPAPKSVAMLSTPEGKLQPGHVVSSGPEGTKMNDLHGQPVAENLIPLPQFTSPSSHYAGPATKTLPDPSWAPIGTKLALAGFPKMEITGYQVPPTKDTDHVADSAYEVKIEGIDKPLHIPKKAVPLPTELQSPSEVELSEVDLGQDAAPASEFYKQLKETIDSGGDVSSLDPGAGAVNQMLHQLALGKQNGVGLTEEDVEIVTDDQYLDLFVASADAGVLDSVKAALPSPQLTKVIPHTTETLAIRQEDSPAERLAKVMLTDDQFWFTDQPWRTAARFKKITWEQAAQGLAKDFELLSQGGEKLLIEKGSSYGLARELQSDDPDRVETVRARIKAVEDAELQLGQQFDETNAAAYSTALLSHFQSDIDALREEEGTVKSFDGSKLDWGIPAWRAVKMQPQTHDDIANLVAASPITAPTAPGFYVGGVFDDHILNHGKDKTVGKVSLKHDGSAIAVMKKLGAAYSKNMHAPDPLTYIGSHTMYRGQAYVYAREKADGSLQEVTYVPHAQKSGSQDGAITSERGKLRLIGFTPKEASDFLNENGLIGELADAAPFNALMRGESRIGDYNPLHPDYVSGKAELPKADRRLIHGVTASAALPAQTIENIFMNGGIKAITQRHEMGILPQTKGASVSGDMRSGIDHNVFVGHAGVHGVGASAHTKFALKPSAFLRRNVTVTNTDFGSAATRYENYRQYREKMGDSGNIYEPLSPAARQKHLTEGAHMHGAEFNLVNSISVEDIEAIGVPAAHVDTVEEMLASLKAQGAITEIPRVLPTDSSDTTFQDLLDSPVG